MKEYNDKSTRTKNLFFIYSLLTLLISIVIKIALNLHYEIELVNELTELLSIENWFIIFTIVNFVTVFISALGTRIFINLVGKLNTDVYIDLAKDIYILYFSVYSMINLSSVLISTFTNQALSLVEVNLINFLFFILLSFSLFVLIKDWSTTTKSIRLSLYVFILNAGFPIYYVLKNT